MHTEPFDLPAYLRRIGHSGEVRPDLATLEALHRSHVARIPFEGLDPFSAKPVDLAPHAVFQKLVGAQRGGYCFEQNSLFQRALQAVGFSVTPLGARVRWMSPPDAPLGPKTHMLLKIDLPEGPHIADVGFGVCVLDAPLRLTPGEVQETAMGQWRITFEDGLYALTAQRGETWRTTYVFDLTPQLPSDYELGSWYASTSPKAPFPNMLIVERVEAPRRFKLVNRQLSVEGIGGEVFETREMESAAEWRAALELIFGIEVPGDAEVLFNRCGPPV